MLESYGSQHNISGFSGYPAINGAYIYKHKYKGMLPNSAFSPIIETNTETKKIETKKETHMKIEIQIKLAIQIQKKCQPIFLMFRFWRGFF